MPAAHPAVDRDLRAGDERGIVAGQERSELGDLLAPPVPAERDLREDAGQPARPRRRAINNGVIVSLASGGTWTVTGTSYLTSLSLDATSAVAVPPGGQVTVTVDGAATAIKPGASYTGAIVLTPA